MILSKWNNSGSKFMEGNPKYHFYILLTSKVYKKDVTEKSLILSGFFAYFGNVFREQNFKIALFFIAKILLDYRTYLS